MPSILVVEQEPHSAERVKAALNAEGWGVQVMPGVGQALQAAAAAPPDLVIAGTDLPGFEILVSCFSRAAGGPGLVGLAPAQGAGAEGADGRLAKPFTDQQMVLAARQALLARRQPSAVAGSEQKLTSRDIFGDVLAEVESTPAPRPAAPPPAPDEEIQRRLEKTLSGVLGVPPKPRSAAERRSAPATSDVDALLSKTLSSLDLGRAKTGVRPPVPPGAAAPAFPQPAAAPPPTSPAAVRRAPPPAPAPAGPEPLSFAPPVEPMPAPLPTETPAEAFAAAATQRIPMIPEASADQPGERFGQYTLLERIAAGGMAEVWKARMRGVEGFQKTVAIKRILPHMTDDAEFVGMFIDEAKLAAQLTHPNIVHIYDLGKIGRDYYIAMEYVEGKDLRSLLNAGRRRGVPLPLGLSLLIAARVASALDYAHRKRDFEGHELGLVHRDVSPQNVLLTEEGDVKLCDFGIAKAVSKAGQTQMGALKGKLQYMSPEQAWGRAVDARSDLFSLGAVLFEMVTGERLFPGDSEISVLEAVRQGRTRTPRQVEPAIPGEVDEIVARAVAVDPEDRFQSAGEMKQRLEAALASLAPSVGPTDLAAYLSRVLEPESGERAAALPAPAFSSRAVGSAAAAPAGPAAPIEPVAPLVEVSVEEEGERKGRTLLYAAIAALLLVAVLTFVFLNRRKEAAPAPQSARPSEAPAAPGRTAPPAVAPAAQATPPSAVVPADIQAIVNQELETEAEELRRQQEKQIQELERQVAAAKVKGPPPLPAAPARQAAAEAAPPRPAAPAPAPALPAPRPELQREPEPPKAQDTPAAPEPEPAREPEPEPRVQPGDLVEPGAGVIPPKLVSSPKPEYPPMARKLGVEGIVTVAVLVDENGQVQDVRMVEPIKQKVGINEAAVATARALRYQPATQDGVRVKMWTRLRIPFKR